MSKVTITRVFAGSLVAFVGGIALVILGVIFAIGSGTLEMSGPDVTGFRPSAVGWSTIGFVIVGVLAMIGGAIGQFVAWIGAVVNTSYLEEKTWFVLLLVLGLLSFGFVAMIVYVLAGPDGVAVGERRAQPA